VILEVTAGGETLATTPGHPFWVLDHGWKDAGELEVGDHLVNLRGESVVVEDIRRRPVPEAVYNFSVAGLHTYFVGQGGIWVHNNSGSGCGVPGAAAKTPLWTSTSSKSSVQNAFGHWQKHGTEFPEFHNAAQYVEATKDFINSPPLGTLTKVRPNGDKLFYNPANNTFAVQAPDGSPRTMFRPTTGINYWNKQ
jgi:hypothetical protein